MELKIEKVNRTTPVVLPDNLVFGANFSDHMFVMDWEGGEWKNATIKKYEDFAMSPAAMSLHYGQAIFEGLKAYKQDNGNIAIFRPDKNLERMNNSAARLCMPTFDVNFVMDALTKLISIEKDWIPTQPGYSLYIRPFMCATEPALGVRPANKYKLFIILSPVGPYYPQGFKPVPIYCTRNYVRAVRKGVGDCKCAGNYAASLKAQAEAKAEGYAQVLWLDAIEQRFIEEVGTMNLFIRFKDEVATPRLTGSILPGVTRMSAIQVLKDWGYNMVERDITIDEVFEANEAGNLLEVFGTGTAAVISAVSKIKFDEKMVNFSDDEPGELSKKLYKEITDIQYARIEDRYGWIKNVD
ncbi:MAG: branched-chain amino acid aminotransferase [Bacteroidetes bacterium]|nr:branched-chain amino acid aminotransferase [Bacteroidota bacterium]